MLVQCFGYSLPFTLDEELAYRVLRPHVVAGDATHQPLLIRASDDSEIEVYVDPKGIMVDRPRPGVVLDIVADLVKQLDAVLILPGFSVLVTSEFHRASLPDDLRRDAVVVELTGAAVLSALRGE
ncbi:hypothetical protein [Streptomyces sp. NPDC002328]|uniref:hypothetical protein n=1 Tax=Streptomyces sp. NPDC002328 TaxID=3364642 RepID=UPI00368CC3EA